MRTEGKTLVTGCPRCGRRMGRERFLKMGGASVAGAALLGGTLTGCGGGAGQGGSRSASDRAAKLSATRAR